MVPLEEHIHTPLSLPAAGHRPRVAPWTGVGPAQLLQVEAPRGPTCEGGRPSKLPYSAEDMLTGHPGILEELGAQLFEPGQPQKEIQEPLRQCQM